MSNTVNFELFITVLLNKSIKKKTSDSKLLNGTIGFNLSTVLFKCFKYRPLHQGVPWLLINNNDKNY